MGNVCAGALNNRREGDILYRISVTTGTCQGAGTDADVTMTIVGTNGRFKTPLMDKWFYDDFEKGQCDRYGVWERPIGDVCVIKLHVDERGFYPDWFVDKVEVEVDHKKLNPGKLFSFPIFEWVGNGQWVSSGVGQVIDILPDGGEKEAREAARTDELYAQLTGLVNQ
jgi:hypothetical protein